MPNAYTLDLSWNQVAGADGYVLWMRYGVSATTAAWDRIAVLNGATTTAFRADALNPGKTYGFKVHAFNAAGTGPSSAVLNARAASGGVPLAPEALTVPSTGRTWIRLLFTDNADNESGFVIQRQLVDAGGPVGPFEDRAKIGPAEGIGVEVDWTGQRVDSRHHLQLPSSGLYSSQQPLDLYYAGAGRHSSVAMLNTMDE